MIKINLASRKTSAVVTTESSGKKGLFGLDLSFLKAGRAAAAASGPSIQLNEFRNIALAAVVGFGMFYFIEGEKQKELDTLDGQVSQLQTEQNQLKTEANKITTYEQVKQQLEADEALMRNKLDTIKKLMSDRTTPPRLLLTLAQSIPADVWLREFTLQNSKLTLQGSAASFSQVSEFLRVLNESIFFKNVELRGTEEAKLEGGIEVKNFELTAERR